MDAKGIFEAMHVNRSQREWLILGRLGTLRGKGKVFYILCLLTLSLQ